MHLAPSKHTLTEDARPPFCAGRKLSDIDKALLWTLLHEDPECPTRALLDKVAHRQRPLAVSVRHLNRLRVTWQRNRRKGRPRQPWPAARPLAQRSSRSRPICRLWACIFLPIGSTSRRPLSPVVAQLTQAIEAYKRAHPSDDFALLHHREQTLRRRFQALFFAPLFGIDRPHRVRYPRASAPDAAWPGLSQLNAEAVSGATRAHRCR